MTGLLATLTAMAGIGLGEVSGEFNFYRAAKTGTFMRHKMVSNKKGQDRSQPLL